MFNKYKIIIAKAKVKERIFLFWGFSETIMGLFALIGIYYLLKGFIGDLYALAIGGGVASIIFLLYFVTDFGLNVMDMLKLIIRDFKSTKTYYWFPQEKINIVKEEDVLETNKEEYEIEYKRKRRKK